ncbi:MAG: homocysteine S-methyltransferase family protein, partial [Candidatus Omnitrophota bacterium]
MNKLKNILNKRVVILDGATGTELQKRGMPEGVSPEIWSLENRRVLQSIHSEYKKAGVDILYTCTFGANGIKLKQYGSYNTKNVNRDLVFLARACVGRDILIAGDIGPCGMFVEPFGPLKFEEAVRVFKEQAQGLLAGGVDLFVIETMMDIQEARAALIAVKELSDKFTIVTMTYDKDGKTLNGTDSETALITLQSLGADAVGCNCSSGPAGMLDFIGKMKPYATVPLVARPNAGMPNLRQGKTYFDMAPDKFASFGRAFVEKGVNILGGCCGTSPRHISRLKKEISGLSPLGPLRRSLSALSSARRSIVIGRDKPLIVVGECINPTGKKVLRQHIQQNKISFINQLAKEQEENGADLLDVNLGVPGIDEGSVFKQVVYMLSLNTPLPLVIDSSIPAVIEAVLRVYPGRALINSLSCEKKRLKKMLPLAAKYGAMFILLPVSKKEVPKTFKERKAIIERAFDQAKKYGFSKDDIVVDAIVLAVSSSPDSAAQTMKTIAWCYEKYAISTILGLSNISFGMPQRAWINAAYLAMAQARGLTMVIANPLSEAVMNIKLAADMLLAKDVDAASFLDHFSKRHTGDDVIFPMVLSPEKKVYESIVQGNRQEIKNFV